MTDASLGLIKVFDDADSLLDYLESYKGETADVEKLRYNLKDEN